MHIRMNRRLLIALLSSLAAVGSTSLLAPQAWAEDDGGDSGSDGGDDSEDDGNNGGGDGGNGFSDPGGSDDDEHDGEDDHDDALRAVEAKDAIPLKQMFGLFKRNFAGKIVDVSLIRLADTLRYRFKFIDPSGRVRRVYFDAMSGELIR